MTLTNPVELPSLDEIEKMDKQRQEAIESLEISNDHVKCQKCGVAVPIVGKLARPHYDRIAYVEKQIKWAERYHNNADIKQLKDELTELLKEEQEIDKLRKLPLYSSKITSYQYVCSKCYDEAYWFNFNRRKSN